ncbi:zinc finger protein CONSTANS-LIKE 3-like [Sesamum indicum]|uniref:Zinc finger protein CONSTANS-LIKE 3-like n=1 Tax=Sesamum indicum TaxID=4182 RepID=A0A6I9TY95_SESIN|nr:zinc finger protein CONSTANS-LIKE 3-like [Sesamum indicum]
MFGHEGNGFFLELQYPQFPSTQLGYSSNNASTRSVENNLDSYYPVHPLSPWDFESEISAVKKVLGTDDLQVVNSAQKDRRSNSPLASESSATESTSRASRYSPEERKERIERYRSKRNLRNFNKKIKEDFSRQQTTHSRPRVKGRFARNNEIGKARQTGAEEDDEDEDNWISILDALIP